MKIKFFCLALFLLNSLFIYAQSATNSDLYKKGLDKLGDREYTIALQFFDEHIKQLESSTNTDSIALGWTYFKKGVTERLMRKNKAALVHVKTAYGILTRQDSDFINHPDLVYQMAYAHHINSKYKEAKPFFEKGTLVFRNRPISDTLSIMYRLLGSTNWRLSNYNKALIYCDTAELVLNGIDEKKANEHLRSIYDIKGDIKRKQYQYEEALKDYDKAIYYNQNSITFDTFNYINVIEGKSSSYTKLGDYYKSLKMLDQAKQIAIQKYGEDDIFLAPTYINIGYTQKLLGQYNQALANFQNAVRIAKAGGYAETYYVYSSAYENIGDVYLTRANYSEAYTYFKKTSDIYVQKYGANHPRTLNMKNAIASVLGKTEGREQEAISMLENVQEVYLKKHGPDSREMALNLAELSAIYIHQNNPDAAIPLIKKSVAIRKVVYGAEHQSTAIGLKLLANAYLVNGQLSDAESTYKEALRIYQTFPSIFSGRTEVLSGLAEIYKTNKTFNQAELAIDSALVSNGFYQNKPSYEQVEDLPLLISTLLLRLNIKSSVFDVKKDPNALKGLDSIIDFANGASSYARSGAIERKSKQEIEAQLSAFYSAAAHLKQDLYSVTKEQVDFESSLQLADVAKNARLLSKLQFDRLKNVAGVPENVLDKEQVLQSEVYSLERLLSSANEEKKSFYEKVLFEKKTELYSFNDRIKSDYPAYFDLKYQTELSDVDALKKEILSNKKALILLDINDEKTLVYCFLKGGHYLNSVSTKELSLDLKKLQQLDKDQQSTFLQSSRNLYLKLFSPIIEILPSAINQLVIVPDEQFAYFPYETLVTSVVDNEPRYLFNDFAISYAYSIALLLENYRLKSRGNNAHLSMAPSYNQKGIAANLESDLIIAELVRSGNYELPGALLEAEKITDLLDGILLSNDKATETAFKKTAGEFSSLHLSMHAIMDELDPMNSRLVFYNDSSETDDGLLHANELYNLNLNADLVVLSACNTGQGQIVNGEGVMSISRAFAYSGVPSTIMSLWKVPDESTSKIMISFYNHLKTGISKSEALRQAKLDYLNSVLAPEQKHPYYWAGFILTGNDDPIEFNSAWSMKTIVLFILMAIAILWMVRRGMS